MRLKIFILFLFSVLFITTTAHSQSIALKSNILYDASTTLNVSAEFKVGARTTFELPVNYNPWTYSDNKKLKHILVQPELRFWGCEAFFGHYWGVHAHYGYYNMGGVGPFKALKDYRYEGWLAGGGLTYGYHWPLSNRWSLEANIGVGYAYMDYSKNDCRKCGEKQSDKTKHYYGPTKIGVSLIYFLK